MNLKRLLSLSLILLAVGVLPANGQSKSHHVLFALTSSDEIDWKLTIGNIRNLLAGLPGADTEVEVVVYGPGLSFLRKASTAEADIQALEAKHVHFVACKNSMKQQHVTADGLISGVSTVPSGVIEVVTKQEQGWSYIKAGR